MCATDGVALPELFIYATNPSTQREAFVEFIISTLRKCDDIRISITAAEELNYAISNSLENLFDCSVRLNSQ